MGRLTALAVSKAKTRGLYADGGGLYLQVSAAGHKSWIFRFKMGGRKVARDMGLGSLADVSLAEAREKARDARKLLDKGIDPVEAKRESRANAALERADAMTFEEAAQAYIAAHADAWRNPKHKQQWPNTLRDYVYPVMGKLPVAAVSVGHVLKALEPVWREKPETASRVRGRIEAVLNWAKARGLRAGENPAQWRGHLSNLLPSPGKVRRAVHHPALPYADAGAFMAGLAKQEGDAALALRFLILTAARTGEVIGARWDEISLDNRAWTVPAERIKAGKEHRVPLSAPALAILKALRKTRDGELVFPGGRKGKALSSNALLALLKRMGREDITPHGFRSTFRDWAAEQTNYPREVAEAALAHAVGDKVEAAYRRGDLFEKRARLMEEWAGHCESVAPPAKGAKVVPLRKRR